MSANDAVSTFFGNGAGTPSTPSRPAMGIGQAAAHGFWRFTARPSVLAGGFSVLAIISITSFAFIVMSHSQADLVTHTLQVQKSIYSLRAEIDSAESGARGYLITNDTNHLADYNSAVEKIMPAVENLKAQTVDNPVQQQALAELRPLIVLRLEVLQEIVRLTGSRTAAAVAFVRSGSGRALMTDIDKIIVRMTEEERGLLALRNARSEHSNLLLFLVNLAGIALMIALAAISILTVRRMGAQALHDSEQRAAELQAAVNELDAFSYSVSHDLRTPLRAIGGFSRILLKHHASELAPEPREYLQAVHDNTEQMSHLVDDLLAFARLNRKSLTKRKVSTQSIVDQVLQEAQKQAEGRTVSVTVGDLPTVWGDPALLKQVFVNLIGNAFKYTRKREDATVEIGSSSIGGEQVIFVRDNGVGFDMQYTDKLFGVFQRLHRAEEFEGTGVGLAIVHRIISRHGGRIWAEAAVNQGAAFFFTTEAPYHA